MFRKLIAAALLGAAFTAPATAVVTVTPGSTEGVLGDPLAFATVTATSGILGGFYAADAFDQVTPDTTYGESGMGHVIFQDTQNVFINFNTAALVRLSNIVISVAGDVPGNPAGRSLISVELFAGATASSLTSLGSTLVGPGANTITYSFAPVDYQYFSFTGVNFSNGARLNEIDGVAATGAVPEPASWAMMVLGFGLAGFALRSRRPARAFAA